VAAPLSIAAPAFYGTQRVDKAVAASGGSTDSDFLNFLLWFYRADRPWILSVFSKQAGPQ
jgi:hypothetical protein